MASEKHAQLALQQVEAKFSKHPNVVGLGIVSATDDLDELGISAGVLQGRVQILGLGQRFVDSKRI